MPPPPMQESAYVHFFETFELTQPSYKVAEAVQSASLATNFSQVCDGLSEDMAMHFQACFILDDVDCAPPLMQEWA